MEYNRSEDVGSVYGNPQRISYKHIEKLNKEFNRYKVLVIDDKDAYHSIPFLMNGASRVVMYEPDIRFINGGRIGSYNIPSIKKRKNYNKVYDRLEIRNENFYETKVEDNFDFVFCFRSLHENHNKHITMDKKLKKLMSSVKPGGYLYIFYHMAKVEKDYSNFYKEQYFRNGEIAHYFDKKNWNIVFIDEFTKFTNHSKHPGHESEHTHLVGHILAKKRNNRLVYRYHYNILKGIRNES